MTIEHYGTCPLCAKVFKHDGEGPRIMLDGRIRVICEQCAPRLVAVPPEMPKTNGRQT